MSSATAAASPAKPAILVIQGAFQLASMYADFEALLRARGHEVTHPVLASCNPADARFRTATIADDAAIVRAAADDLLARRRPFVALMHSYGGLVAAEAFTPDYARDHRAAQGLPGGLLQTVHLSTLACPLGQSMLSAYGVSDNIELLQDGTVTFRNAGEVLFSDLAAGPRAEYAAKTVPQSLRIQGCPMTVGSWRYVPSSYIVLDRDRAIPPSLQEAFARLVGARKTVHLDADHEPFVGRAQELVGSVEEAMLDLAA